jgi:hypothetical protein
MSSRNIFRHVVCVVSALALLVAVITSPIRPSTLAVRSSNPDCLGRNVSSQYTTHSSRLSATSVTSPTNRVRALPSDKEEESSEAACLAHYSFDLSPTLSTSRRPARNLADLGPVRAPHFLRC